MSHTKDDGTSHHQKGQFHHTSPLDETDVIIKSVYFTSWQQEKLETPLQSLGNSALCEENSKTSTLPNLHN